MLKNILIEDSDQLLKSDFDKISDQIVNFRDNKELLLLNTYNIEYIHNYMSSNLK